MTVGYNCGIVCWLGVIGVIGVIGVGYGFFVASNVCISVVKNQGSTNISTHTGSGVSFRSLCLHFLSCSNALGSNLSQSPGVK